MNCQEFMDEAGSYALGALDATDQRAMEAHLRDVEQHEGCAEALTEAQLTMGLLTLSADPVTPRRAVWSVVENQVAPKRDIAARRKEPSLGALLPWGVAAAAASVAIFVIGQRALMNREVDRLTAEIEQLRYLVRETAAPAEKLLTLMQQPGAQVVTLKAQGDVSYKGTAVVHLGQKKALVFVSDMDRVKGKDFQLWVIRGGKKHPAGLLRTQESGRTLFEVDSKLLASAPDALAVTLEPEGGVPQPTGPIVLLGNYRS